MRPSPAGWGRAGTHVAVAPATEAHDDDDADRAEYEEQDEGDHEARGAAGHVGGQINCWWQLNEAARPADEGPSAIPRRRSRSRSGFST